ncbi:hypothetical protein M2323_000438 [Rhodoblastus acidophilus]|uniref:hypothetical protein n=1 Tax=Rhodoblastus acidophilus TaxID=1074 RepID=UPI002225926E|nr:hypothetical protein [Rhodoblastus acidophilus]MCW2282677.1 hypothetical protein [Rhodoblastus acidophilus]MCW2331538.1 hypothetical protein [Rhodoblastus acidophilus]
MADPQVGFFCKSYAYDFKHLRVMLASFAAHNPDNLPLTLSLPSRDIKPFLVLLGAPKNVTIVADEDYCGFDLAALPGWYAQQVCKLASWRATGLDHHAVLDSDSYFIADVTRADLAPPPGKTAIVWGSGLRTVLEPEGSAPLLAYAKAGGTPQPQDFPPVRPPPRLDFSRLHAISALSEAEMSLEARSGAIFEFFGAKQWFFYQPGQIFARDILIAFEQCMASGGLDLVETIKIAPWEYNWYGEYAAAFHAAETEFRVSPVFHVAKREAALRAAEEGLTEAVLARSFTWVQMASRHLDLLKL